MIATYSNILMIFSIKEKNDNFDPCNVLLYCCKHTRAFCGPGSHIWDFSVSKDQGMSKVMLFNFNNAILYNGYACQAFLYNPY